MAKTDKLAIVVKFNGKTVKLTEDGDTAYPTFKSIMSLFTDNSQTEQNDKITAFE